MLHTTRLLTFSGIIFVMLATLVGCRAQSEHEEIKTHEANMLTTPMRLYIIVGSVRPTGTADKIANNIKQTLDKRADVQAEIVFVGDYALPFYTDIVAPVERKDEITDPVLKKWSDKIKQADAYILLAPEYNVGYPASLKNALDSLYKEWNNKPVAFVGYSGGPSGGTSTLAQLRQVAQAFKMIPVAAEVKIPYSWKAFNEQGDLVNLGAVEVELNTVVDQLLAIRNAPKQAK